MCCKVCLKLRDSCSDFRKGKSVDVVADSNCMHCFAHIRISTLAEPESGITVFFLTSKLSTPSLGSPRNLSFVITGLVVAEEYRHLSLITQALRGDLESGRS